MNGGLFTAAVLRIGLTGIVPLVAATLSGCADEAAAPSAETVNVPTVTLHEVSTALSEDRAEAVGTVRLADEVQLAFTTPGRIALVSVDDGDLVKKGELLAALEPDRVASDLAAAQAEAERAGRELRRLEALRIEGWVTEGQLDAARAASRSANAAVKAASFSTRTSRITAPADGVVLERLAEPGQIVDAGTPVLAFGRGDGGFILQVPLTDREANRRSLGEAAEARIQALGEPAFPVRLTRLAGRADPQTGTFAAEFTLPPRPGLRSGQVGSVSMAAQDGASALVAPLEALTAARAGEAVLWIYEEESSAVTPRTVTLGEMGDGGVVVTGGIAAGERIVLSSSDALADGQRVRVRVR
jgi:RND family efflux transporter MFP subunit